MNQLAEQVDFVIGVDTHKHTHTGSVVNRHGAELASIEVAADASGYRHLLSFADRHAREARVWAVEGAGCYGSGLARLVLDHGERVVEIDRPARPARRNGAKSDRLDATRAAREALARAHHAEPRDHREREAIRTLLRTRQGAVQARTQAINHLNALVVTAPERLRAQLRALSSNALVARCARLRTADPQSTEERATRIALRASARRILALGNEVNELDAELGPLVRTVAPTLLAELGVGTVTGAEILCAWSHRGRIRCEAAFASLAGVAPVPASSGQTVRYRLNRGGDRRLNRALHTIVLSRLAHHDETKRYAARRRAEGKTSREIRRCLKRHLARRLFKLLQSTDLPATS